MSWQHREISASPEEAIRRLRGRPGAFQLRDEGRLYFGAFPAAESDALDPLEEDKGTGPDQGRLAEPRDWPHWVGALPYEAFRFWERGGGIAHDQRPAPLFQRPLWRRYDAVAEATPTGLLIHFTNEGAAQRLRECLASDVGNSPRIEPSLTWAQEPESGEVHEVRIERALHAISQGQLYQVNLARRFHFRATGAPLDLLSALGPLAQAPFAAAIDFGELQLVSTSPELFLDYSASGVVRTRPIKGTRPRHADPLVDQKLRNELDSSEKERAELAMVVDIERNDLGRISVPGSVRLTRAPHVTSYPTVHHREAEIEAQLRPEVTREQLLLATMPSGSVTGAPKVRAMDLIAASEAERRGLYTGALGYISPSGAMRLSMAIRVLSLRGSEAHYYAGGGIVADSSPKQELEETLWKAEQLRALIPMRR